MSELMQPNFPVYDRPATIVEGQIAAMSARADAALGVAFGTIEALQAIDPGSDTGAPKLSMPPPAEIGIDEPDAPSVMQFGVIEDYVAPDFDLFGDLNKEIDSIVAGLRDPGDFNPSVGAIVIPNAPAERTFTAPQRPTLNPVELPDEPGLPMPDMGALFDLNMPTLGELPTFEDMEPVEFEGEAVNTVMVWAEPEYERAVIDDVIRELKRMLAGGTGMHPHVEAALFSRARRKEDSTALKRKQEVTEKFSASGFTMPPGALAEALNAVEEENQLQVNALAREIMAQSAEWERDNLKHAVSEGIACEKVLIDQFENIAKRVFEAARERLRADIEFFQQHVALFNARQAARSIAAEIFKVKFGAVIDEFKARTEFELAKNGANESTVRVFAARMEALRTIAAVYATRMEGAKIRSDLERSKLDGYKTDVDAFAALIGADKSRYDAYESRVRGEAAKGGILEAEARAFAATLEAQNGQANLKIQAVRGKVDSIQAAVQKFIALLQAEREKVSAQAQAMGARAQAFSADVGRYTAELQVESEQAKLGVTVSENRLRNNLAFYEIRVREYDQAMARIIERARVITTALTAAGNMGSQLASGAMSAMHVQASLSGSGSASTSSSYTYTESHNYEEE